MRTSKQLVPFSFIVLYMIKWVGGDSASSELLSDIWHFWWGIVNNTIEAALLGRAGTKQRHCHSHRWHCDSLYTAFGLSIVPARYFYLPSAEHLSSLHHLNSLL